MKFTSTDASHPTLHFQQVSGKLKLTGWQCEVPDTGGKSEGKCIQENFHKFTDLFPFLSRVGVLRDSLPRANVDRDVPRVYSAFQLAHFGVLTPTPEKTRWLHTEVANL